MEQVQTKRERVLAAAAGKPVDRVPVSAWGHLFPEEKVYSEFARATLRDFRKYDWDFIKVNNPATLYDEAWGNVYDPANRQDIFPKRLFSVTENGKKAFSKIRRLDVTKGVFASYIHEALVPIVQGAEGAPVIQTIFSPLSVLGFIVSDNPEKRVQAVKDLISIDPDATHRVLSLIALTLADFARESVKAGADGVFFAIVQLARKGVFSEDDYRVWGVPYDLVVLEAVIDAPFNLFHNCGESIFFDLTKNYPVHALNYDTGAKGNLSLSEVRSHTSKTIVGGIQQEEVLIKGSPFDVAAEAKKAMAVAGKLKFILTPGCSVNFEKIPEANLRALRKAVD